MHTLNEAGSRTTQQRQPQARTRAPSPSAAPTLYELLQVSRTVTPPVIEAAYQALQAAAATTHARSPAAGADGLELFRAYHILRDPTRRAAYDLELHRAVAEPAPTELPEDATSESEPASTTCWRCSATVSAVARYCSTCHWLICDYCRACGCQNPNWRRERPLRLVRWPLTAVLALLTLTLAVVTTLTIQSGACAAPLATLGAATAAPNLVPAPAPVAILPPAPRTAEPPRTEVSSSRPPRSIGQFVQETFAAVVAGFERSSKK